MYVSDGTSTITRVNADDLTEMSQFTVKKSNGQSQPYINELEFVDGSIWANIFYYNGMVRIDPNSGYIEEFVSFAEL